MQKTTGRDLALKYISDPKANWVFKRNYQKFCVTNLVYLNMLRASSISMNPFMWAAVHFDKDGDQSQRVLRNMDVDQIQKVFPCDTQSDPKSSRMRTVWLTWSAGLGRKSMRTTASGNNCKQRCASSLILFSVLAANASLIQFVAPQE